MQPFIQYSGGKSRVAKKIVAQIPPHKTYVEPMVGGGSVYFAKNPSTKEVIADLDSSLIGFYKDLKQGKIKKCNLTPNKKRFDKVRKEFKNGKNLSSCNYLYLNKMSYGGKMGTTMDASKFEKCSGDKAKKCGIASKNHEKYADRLKKTKIESGDFRKIIKKNDAKNTFFYLDPPYQVSTKDHYRNRDLPIEEVKKAVDEIKGKFILSYNDSPETRKTFCGSGKKKYKCIPLEFNYTIDKNQPNKKVNELLIKNY